MKLQLYRSLWTNGFDLDAAISDCLHSGFDGIEGPLPDHPEAQKLFVEKLAESRLPWIAEVTTGGGYVPRYQDVGRHLDDLSQKLDAIVPTSPILVTALAGCDAWPIAKSVNFFSRAMAVASERGLTASFETHRSRSTFTPWITAEILRELPALELTCDFSHWCCVCERLVLNEEPELLELFVSRARHIHARVGYAQGPQTPHPAAPEYREPLEAHESWWDQIWNAQARSGFLVTTMTPEFGPDGYLQSSPFTATPAGSLDEINHWMATRQRERFALRQPAPAGTR